MLSEVKDPLPAPQPTLAISWKYIAIVGALTIIAALLCEASLYRVRILLPEYPRLVTMGIYAPLAPVQFFHLLGSTALIIVLLAAFGITALNRKLSLPPVLLKVAAAGHILFLLTAILAYGFCLWRISRVLARLM